MSRAKKSDNIEISMRLRAIRINMCKSQAEFAEILEVSDDHYRKLENGSSGLTIDKVRILYEKLSVDPTHLITGKRMDDFDMDAYLANCSKEQKDVFFRRCLAYISSRIIEQI